MGKPLILKIGLAFATAAYAFTWPGHFPCDGLIVKDRGGLPMPSNAIHVNGRFFYYGMFNTHYGNESESVGDVYNSYALGFPVDLGYTFNGKLEVAVTFELIALITSNGIDISRSGKGDVWIKSRALLQPVEGFYVGPRIAGKIPGGNSHLGLGDGWGDIDAGLVFAMYDDSIFKLNGSAGYRYSLEDTDFESLPRQGPKVYLYLEPGFTLRPNFTLYVPFGFGYHTETKQGHIWMDNAGYGFTLGVKPAFILSDNRTLDFTLLYPITGKNANREIYLALTIDLFFPLSSGPGDGITDDVDNCPDNPQDIDGF